MTLPRIPYATNADFHRQVTRTGAYRDGYSPCLICGRAVKDCGAAVLRVVDGGGTIADNGDPDIDPSADLGCYPIGPCCLKRYPEFRPYVIKP